MIGYRGLTWDHPRGFNALAAAAETLGRTQADISIVWEKQPLEEFESHRIADLCDRYDLVVLDHPHVGDAVASGCLRPLEGLFGPDEIVEWERETIGPCLASYRYSGRHWALPLDAATQVMAYRHDLVDERPENWDAVLALSERRPVAVSVAGPHALLTFFSLAAALGEPPAERDPAVLVSGETGERALDIMAALHGRMPVAARSLNPIGLLQMMSQTKDGGRNSADVGRNGADVGRNSEDVGRNFSSAASTSESIALCPLVYGYVNYAESRGERAHPIAFANAPRAVSGGRPGSTLGGTGIGISRRCDVTPVLLAHLRWLMGRDAQVDFIPSHDGQPSRRQAWHDEAVNRRWASFYRNTAETLERAYVRPRHKGYIAFQTEGSGIIRQGLDGRARHIQVLERLQEAYARSRSAGDER